MNADTKEKNCQFVALSVTFPKYFWRVGLETFIP